MHKTFRSVHHPADRPTGLVYVRELAGPIGACTLPVMIAATASALQGHLIWGYLLWGLPTALGVASIWTQFSLSTTTAELHFRPGQCATRSVHDVLYDRSLQWHPLYNVKGSPGQIELSIGWTTRTYRQRNWPDFPDLRSAARQSLDAQSRMGSSSLSM